MVRIRRVCAAVFGCLSLAGCAADSGFGPRGYPLEDKAFDAYLELFDEMPLVPSRDAEVYRLIVQAPQVADIIVRIEHTKEGTIIVAKGSQRGNRIDISRELSDAEWNAFLVEVYDTRYWLSSNLSEQRYAEQVLAVELGLRDAPGGPVYADATSIWELEASSNQLYHYASARYGSGVSSSEAAASGAVSQLGLMMLDLSGIREQVQ